MTDGVLAAGYISGRDCDVILTLTDSTLSQISAAH